MSDEMTPVQPTADMASLPSGSAVFQIINAPLPDGSPNLDMRGVLIGTNQYDPFNPCHRLLAVINNHIDELVAEALGGSVVERKPAQDIESNLSDQMKQDLAKQQELRQAAQRQDMYKAAALSLQYSENGNPAELSELQRQGIEADEKLEREAGAAPLDPASLSRGTPAKPVQQPLADRDEVAALNLIEEERRLDDEERRLYNEAHLKGEAD